MRTCIARAIAFAWLAVSIVASHGPLGADEPPKADPLRQKRLEFLKERVGQFEIQVGGDAARILKAGAEPILRWSNPVRDNFNDGVIYLFFEKQRPRAIVTVWADFPMAKLDQGNVFRELVSLSAEPLACHRDGNLLWSPKAGALVEQAFKEAPAPAARPTQRLTQMRDLARRFEAANYKMGSPSELRLLTQPLYRYPGEAGGVLDGGLFAFAEGNDPEVVLLLEAVQDSGGKGHVWRYALGRMTSYRVSVKFDKQEVFTAQPYWANPRSPADPYSETFEGTFVLDPAGGDAPTEKKEK